MMSTTPLLRITFSGLLLLPILSAWVFFPQLSSGFAIKHYVSTLASLLLALFFCLETARFDIPKGAIGSSLLGFLLAIFISAVNAENFALTMKPILELTTFILLAIIIFNLRDIPALLGTFETAIVVAGLGVALFAIKQHFLPSVLDPGFDAQGKMKIYSTLGNPNLAALVMLASIPSSAWRTLRGSTLSRANFAAVTLILIAGLWFTQARHAFVAICVMGVTATFWLGAWPIRRKLLAGLLIATVAVGILLLLTELPPSIVHSIKGRWFIWRTALQILWDHPLAGVGVGHFGLNHSVYQGELFASGQFDSFFDNASVISEAHNDFLNWGAMTGVLGLIGFTALCVVTLLKGWQSQTLKQQAPQLYLALTGYVVAMFFIAVTSYTVPGLLYWLLVGVVWLYADLTIVTWSPSSWFRRALAVCLAVLIIHEGYSAWLEVRAGFYEAQGDKLMAQHDLWLADKAYQQALQKTPHSSGLLKKRATTLYLSGDLQQARSELTEAKKYSGDLGIQLLEGEILVRLGELNHAAAAYQQISASFPNMVGPHFILGQIYLQQGGHDAAQAEFRKVLDIRPSPYNLNMTPEKVDLQKRIVRAYLHAPPSGPAEAIVPAEAPESPD